MRLGDARDAENSPSTDEEHECKPWYPTTDGAHTRKRTTGIDAYDGSVSASIAPKYAALEPSFDDPAASRAHRKERLALAYRLFGALHWGEQGDGHISARDPERTDCFWLIKYGVPFGRVTVDDLVLIGPGGEVVGGDGEINASAYFIHGPILAARPDVVSVAHTHTPYGTPWSANVEPFTMICQEATSFYGDQALFDDGEVDIWSVDGGKRIAAALGETKLVILGNHGLLTAAANVDETVGWFLMAERVSEVHIKAQRPKPISDEDASRCAISMGSAGQGWKAFNFAARARLG